VGREHGGAVWPVVERGQAVEDEPLDALDRDALLGHRIAVANRHCPVLERLDVDRDGNVTSRLTVDRPDTLDLLRRDAAGLERALQDAGLKTANNGLQFSLRDQSMNEQQAGTSPGAAVLVATDESLPSIDNIPQRYRLAGQGGGLDIRV